MLKQVIYYNELRENKWEQKTFSMANWFYFRERKTWQPKTNGWKRVAASNRKYRLSKLYRIVSVIVNPGLSVAILQGNRSKNIETIASISKVSVDIAVCLQNNTQRSLLNLKLYSRLSKTIQPWLTSEKKKSEWRYEKRDGTILCR
jgi:hypothetical protein